MSYLALARQYRPDDFSKILAQNHITRTLANAISTGRISHAYLFCGPRGTGKTSTARVLAKSLNCEKGPTSTPCGECVNCKEIKAGISPDVFEIDAASNRGIDDIRELRENVRYAPAASRSKIYIIDEVHRLTNEAFDALLKTLEEPPPHVIFMFATTEPQKLPATILSRTQRFDFKRVPVSSLAETVTNVAQKEGLDLEAKAALLIGRKADGSLRDALSLLDQLISFSEGKITVESTAEILGLVKTEFLFEMTTAVIEHDTARVLELFNIYFSEGSDIDQLASELMSFISKLLMIKNGIRETALLEMDSKEIEKAESVIADTDTSDLLRMMKVMGDFVANKKAGVDPVVAMEVALTSLAGLDKTIEISQLLAGVGQNPGNPAKAGRITYGKKANPRPVTNPAKARSAKPSPGNDNPNPVKSKAEPSVNHQVELSTGPHELTEIEKWWPNFLGFVKAKRQLVWSNLQHAVIGEVDDNLVKLGFSEINNGNKMMLVKEKKFIAEQLSEFCGNDTEVAFVKGSIEKNSTANINDSNQGSAEEFLESHPKVKKIHDLIDGKVIGYKGNNK
ncbi:MAG: DNA polymerase III subunit gamma/tau [candidate division Zixibacteria bacterium]|nr:DNA polymerase III subunit gamma/tau [candidate division Zixibacteria bacterium]